MNRKPATDKTMSYDDEWASMPLIKLEAIAKSGDAEAQFTLANRFVQNKASKHRRTTDAADAAMWYRRAAEQGHCNAQYRLGLAYTDGDGVAEDYHEAAKWFLKSAEQGNAWAQYRLGECCKRGQGINQNRAEAVKWFRCAAALGLIDAKAALSRMKVDNEIKPERLVPAFVASELRGTSQTSAPPVKQQVPQPPNASEQTNQTTAPSPKEEFERGHQLLNESKEKEAVESFMRAAEGGYMEANLRCGIIFVKLENYAEAVKWFHKAAKLGDSKAGCWLGISYQSGCGVTRNYGEAAKWFTLAAESGDASAQFYLGRLYAEGNGVSQSPEEAAKWNAKAAIQGFEQAKEIQARSFRPQQKDLNIHALSDDRNSKKPVQPSPAQHVNEGRSVPSENWRDRLPTWVTWALPVFLAWLAFVVIAPEEPRYENTYDPPQPVDVSAYTRSDGTRVSGYNRALPGEREMANVMNQPIVMRNLKKHKDYKERRLWAWTGAVLVFFISRASLKMN